MAKTSAMVFGVIFVLVGILGFISGNGIVGQGAFFEAGAIHNIVHLILGILLIWAAVKMPAKSGKALLWIGVIYLVVAILGFIWQSVLGIFSVNGADNWLHLVLAVILIAIGWSSKKSMATAAPMSPMSPQM